MVSLFLLFPAACAASILYYRRFFPSRQWLRGLWKNFLRRAAAPILFFAPAGCIRPEKNICLHPPAIGKRKKRRALARRFHALFGLFADDQAIATVLTLINHAVPVILLAVAEEEELVIQQVHL